MNKFYQSKSIRQGLSAILIGGILVSQSGYALAQETIHTVSHGEYLYLIAQKYGITVQDLQNWNHLSTNYIYTGDQLIVSKPVATTVAPVPESTTTVEVVTSSQEVVTTTEEVLVTSQEPSTTTTTTTEPPTTSSQVASQTYTVKPGDYLYKIASMYGVTVDQIKTWNKLTSNYIYSGDKLVVSKPGVHEVTTTEAPTTTEKVTTTSSVPTAKTYTVRAGDYLYKIASMYGVTVNQIRTWNKLSSNLIFSGQKLYVSQPGASTVSPTPTTEAPTITQTTTTSTEKPTTTTTEAPTTSQTPATIYTVKSGDYLYKIASMYGVTVDQIKTWNNLSSNYIYTGDQLIVSPGGTPTPGIQSGIHAAVQAVLNKYSNSPIRVHYESLVAGDHRTAGLRPDSTVYGASVPKIVITAYVQDQIEKGNLSWNTSFPYSDAIYNHAESYAWGGSGSIQYQYNFRNKSYTVLDLVNKTIKESDNLASNMLLHYVGFKNKADFDSFTQRVYGEPKYHRNISPRQYNLVLKHLMGQKEQVVIKAMDQTIYDGTKIDAIPANTYQKIGAWWPYYNHSAGIVEGPKPFVLTILTDYWSDSAIGSLAKQIYNAVINNK